MTKPIHEILSDVLDSGALQRARSIAMRTWLKHAAEFDRISAEDPHGDPFENGLANADLSEEVAFLAAQKIHEAIRALEAAVGASDVPYLDGAEALPASGKEARAALNAFMGELEFPKRRRRWSFDLLAAESSREECEWYRHDTFSNMWMTGCNNAFVFPPGEFPNRCPGCGLPVVTSEEVAKWPV